MDLLAQSSSLECGPALNVGLESGTVTPGVLLVPENLMQWSTCMHVQQHAYIYMTKYTLPIGYSIQFLGKHNNYASQDKKTILY